MKTTLALALVAAMGLTLAQVPAAVAKTEAKPKVCSALKSVDPDNDGKFDLAEAKKAAEAAFDKINKDSDKTLEGKELGGRLSKKAVKAGDPDKDGTLDKAEYVAIVEKLFTAANKDKDGTLECKELNSSAGRAMLKLLK
jgi:Ca2+-binding EF-hand superfamily protein